MPRRAYAIAVHNQQSGLRVDKRRLRAAVRAVLDEAGLERASVSVAVVDDPTIQDLNRRFLRHDRPTDVLSFVLESGAGGLEGEVIVSADTARAQSQQWGWSAAGELLLYVVHGTLHLVGYNDATPKQRGEMHAREQSHLARFGLEAPGRGRRIVASG